MSVKNSFIGLQATSKVEFTVHQKFFESKVIPKGLFKQSVTLLKPAVPLVPDVFAGRSLDAGWGLWLLSTLLVRDADFDPPLGSLGRSLSSFRIRHRRFTLH